MKPTALVLVSILYGLIAGYLFPRLTNRRRIRRTIDRIVALVLEFRLYLDEPRTIVRAQRDLLRENLRLFGQVALPCLIMGAAFALLYPPMNRFFGNAPLQTGEAIVITAHTDIAPLTLETPEGITVETPGVRAVKTHETSWRIRPLRSTTGRFRVLQQGSAIAIRLDVPYPKTHWLAWFVAISTASAILFLRRLAEPM